MANASVEKLKALGIRHGEKAVVAVTALAFIACTALAVLRETMPMQPEELASAANNASANLSKVQPQADVLSKLEKAGLVDPGFVKIVDNQIQNALKPDPYRARQDWVTPEPGAGLIRDQPELIAPTEVAAFPGRGGILMYTLDEKGERIPDTGEEAKKKGGRRRPGPPPGMSGSGMGGPPPRDESPAAKKRREAEEEKRKKQFAGKVDEKAKGKEGEAAPDPTAEGPFKEETKGKRWVVITGVIDNEKLKKNYLLALKNPAIAYPNYLKLEVERKILGSDGVWGDWQTPDLDAIYAVLDNLPEIETEFVPDSQRPKALVDHLPFLRAGYWTGVHVAKLVPAEILAGPKDQPGPAGGGSPGGMMGPSGMGSRQGGGGNSMMGAGGPGAMMGPGMGSRPGGGGNAMMGAGGEGGGGGMMGSGGGPAGGGDAEEANFEKIEAKTVMLRFLDFTVDQNTTYQYRVRIVVRNPNLNHTDVNPGVDVDSKALRGPWSEPTDPVGLPADVAAYAMAPEQAARRDDLVNFQVIKWDAGTGQTVCKYDGAGPGELVGELGSIQMPSSEGGGAKPASIDFNSRAIVLDTFGGSRKLPDIGLDRNQFVVPAVALLVEPDGSVVVRSQAHDISDGVRKDMESNYNQAIADSGKKREVGSGSRMPGSGSGSGGGDPRFGGKKKKKRR